jgi:nucleoid-associated protein YgaU
MSQDQGDTNTEETPTTDGGSESGGADRGDWQKELAERLAAQKAKREAARQSAGEEEEAEAEEPSQPPPKRDEGPSEWEQEISGEIAQTQALDVNPTQRDDLAGINAAQESWASTAGEARQAVTEAMTWFGDSMASITSFLAPVPAMLLVFLNYKVPIPIPIPVMYKPESLSWSKKAEWHNSIGGSSKDSDCSGKERKTPMRNVPQATFKGGGPELLDLELFFDTTDTQLDVRFMLKPIQALVYKVPLRNEPPLVMFSWGMILSKMSYIEELEIDYTMFRADGTPLRAEVSMTLTEYDLGWLSAIPMNPTSYSEARKTWVVTEGQTLDWIAYQEYGNAMHWRHIAEVNNLTNPRDLRSGQILKLTPLP